MRISQALIKKGVSEAWQHTIYGTCMRDRAGRTTAEEHAKITELCDRIGGGDSAGLYRFLTDKYVNHNYIHVTYGIPKDKLFRMKREFYLSWLTFQPTFSAFRNN